MLLVRPSTIGKAKGTGSAFGRYLRSISRVNAAVAKRVQPRAGQRALRWVIAPCMDIVGLLDAAVQESRQRVQVAIKKRRAALPRKRVVVNLVPASMRKEGPSYDLPIAVDHAQ